MSYEHFVQATFSHLKIRPPVPAIPTQNANVKLRGVICLSAVLFMLLLHHGSFITSCALQYLDDVGWAVCVVEVTPCWALRQAQACQEA